MSRNIHWRRLSAFIGLLTLLSCGGGDWTGIDGSGARPQLSAVGPINGFGSVIVNGVRYNTDNARIMVRGEVANEVDLNVGDYVTVVGGMNAEGEPVAYEVHYQPRVTGFVQAIDVQRNRLVVLGQTIQLLADTVYASDVMPRNIHAFVPGQRVSVSGPMDGDQVIQATRIAFDTSSFVELVGLVDQLDMAEQRFFVNGQEVSLRNIQDARQLANGRAVAVRGSLVDQVLVAEILDLNQDYRQLRHIPSVEFSGIIQRLRSSGGFYMDSVPVSLSASTQVKGGDLSDLVANAKIRVVGSFDANDVLQAQEIKVLSSPNLKIYGEIQEVYPVWAYGLLGKIKVQDQQFLVQVDTRLAGEFDRRINFWDLRVGDQVYVSSYTRGDYLIASSIAVDNRHVASMPLEMQGVAYFVSEPTQTFFLFNTMVVITPETRFSKGTQFIDQNEFFASAHNAYVRVRGSHDYGVLVAESIQIFVPDFSMPGWSSQPNPWGY